MSTAMILSLAALVALVPAAVLPYRSESSRDGLFWLLLAVAIVGPLVWVLVAFLPGWRTGIAPALWTTITLTLILFAITAAVTREGWRLTPLLLPYLFILGLVATIWLNRPERPLDAEAPLAWMELHIGLSVITYALLTLAAVAGLAGFLQDRAFRTKRRNALVEVLPSIADAEMLQVKLLGICAVIMGAGLATGMAVQYFETGAVLVFDHKVLLSLATFVVIVGLLLAHWRSGVRGRQAARMVLLAYLLLTLGYPGVKFVTDVLLA